jgi:hypothetical protein
MSENLTTISSLSGVDTDNYEQKKPQEQVIDFKEPRNKSNFFIKLKTFLKSRIFLVLALLVFFLGVGVFIYFYFFNNVGLDIKDPTKLNLQSKSSYVVKSQNKNVVGTKDYPNPINGVYLNQDTYEEVTQRKPVAVMLNNHPDARPQAGLSAADIVYEVVAEGGISRIMPVFHSNIPDRVGSVRSARIYFMQIAAEYWPIFSHWGVAHRPAYELGLSDTEFADLLSKGAAETDPKADARSYLDEISLPVANTDTTPNLFYREEGLNVATEHTGFAKFKDVYAEFTKFYPEPSWSEFQKFDTWNFKDEKLDSTALVTKFTYNFWDFPGFETSWNYNEANNTYTRVQGGVVTTDRNTETPVNVTNVIIQKTKETKLNDVKGHLLYDVIGTGSATIYMDGVAVNALWSKPSARERTVYRDTSGSPIEFNRGLTWVVVLPDYSVVTEE